MLPFRLSAGGGLAISRRVGQRRVRKLTSLERETELETSASIEIAKHTLLSCGLILAVGTVAGLLAQKIRIPDVAVFFALLGITMLIFRGLGRERALALGLMVCQRNMGLMVAATDGVLPGTTWLYFALSQFPIYLSPQLLKPIVQKLRAQKAAAAETGNN